MRILLYSTIISMVLTLAGCAAKTVQGLKDNPAVIESFTVDAGYKVVYRRIARKLQGCYPIAVYGVTTLMHDDIKQGELFIMNMPVGVFVAADIKYVTDETTQVDIYMHSKSWLTTANHIKEFANDTEHSCW